MTIASVQTNVFSEAGKMQSGLTDLSLWPFYEIDSRMGCMKEYRGVCTNGLFYAKDGVETIHSKLFI